MIQKHSSKERTPVHISARFLISTLKQLDKSYTENNYTTDYTGRCSKIFKQLAIQLDFPVSQQLKTNSYSKHWIT